MTDLMERPVEVVREEPRPTLRSHRWQDLHRLFRQRADLRGDQAAAFAEVLHDGPVMGA